MLIVEKLFLLSTVAVSLLALRGLLITWEKDPGPVHNSVILHGVALAVLGTAALLLSVLGWQILGLMGDGLANKLVAIVSTLIPFAWSSGLISRFHARLETPYLVLMALGLVLITVSRFIDAPLMSRIVYPVFHSISALVVIITPILAYRQNYVNPQFMLISLGGALISMGGITLAFLSAGRQLLFFSQDVVMSIMGPLLFVTGLLYYMGLSRGEKTN